MTTGSKLDDFSNQYPSYKVTRNLDIDDPYAEAPTHDTAQKYQLMRHKMIPSDKWSSAVKTFSDRWESWKDEHGYWDFTDLIERAPVTLVDDPSNVALFIDEAQDCSKLELHCLRNWARHCDELVIVGDPRQSLYEWRGAYPEMFSAHGNYTREILSQSYRVPRAVHHKSEIWATKLSDHEPIEYHPTNKQGRVSKLRNTTWRLPDKMISEALIQVSRGNTCMIAMPCAYMLSPTITMLRAQGIPFSNPWRTKNGSWNPLGAKKGTSTSERLLNFLRPDDRVYPDPRSWTATEFSSWVDLLNSNTVLVRGAKTAISALAKTESAVSYTLIDNGHIDQWIKDDHRYMFKEMLSQSTATQRALEWLYQNILGSKRKILEYPIRVMNNHGIKGLTGEPKIYVGTIHSFKGAEADWVAISPDLPPAGGEDWVAGGKRRDSVVKMFYVALTRARDTVRILEAYSDQAVML